MFLKFQNFKYPTPLKEKTTQRIQKAIKKITAKTRFLLHKNKTKHQSKNKNNDVDKSHEAHINRNNKQKQKEFNQNTSNVYGTPNLTLNTIYDASS